MCIAITSYPCPEPDVDELLHRLKNTRKVSLCDAVHSKDGRPLSCAGEVQVQHHHLGQSEFCSWCSLMAKAKYTEARDRTKLKRKTTNLVSDEEGGEVDEGSGAKRIKADVRGETCEAEVKTGTHEVAGQDGAENFTEGLVARSGDSRNTKTAVHQASKLTEGLPTPEECTESVSGSARVSLEPGKPCEERAVKTPLPEPTTKLPSAVQIANETKTPTESGTQAQHPSRTAPGVRKEKAKPTNNLKATLASASKPEVPRTEDKMMTEYEEALSIFEKINQGRVNAVKGYADMLKQETALLQQISHHQDEISGLKTTLSQQNAQLLAEASKKKDAGKDIESQKTTMKMEKQDLETNIGRLMQKIDELTTAASAANEETNTAKARIRGQQNRIAELEGQITIMKKVEAGRKKKLDETLHHNEVLHQQNASVKANSAKSELELLGLRREMGIMGTENSQLRAAIAERVLSTPVPQGPPTATGSPAMKGEDIET